MQQLCSHHSLLNVKPAKISVNIHAIASYRQTYPCGAGSLVLPTLRPTRVGPCLQAGLEGNPSNDLKNLHKEGGPGREEPAGAVYPDLGEEEDADEGRRATDGFFDGKAYRLVTTEGGENTILINGVKMHISMGKLPSQDAEDKARLVKVRKGSTVLDICCGLGYSAIACARLGARRVISLELDPCVLEVARQNPQSAPLFDSGGVIQILMGPAQDSVRGLPDEAFSAVLHDPPRFSHAGELYSQAFYDQIFRVLKCGGRFFHYTGSPNSRSSIPKGVKERLLRSGFVNVKWIDTCQGMLAMKP